MISNAISSSLVTKVVGYQLTAGNFSSVSPNLPQRILIVGEATIAKQSGLDTDLVQITSEKQAGELYGYGSPIHMSARILFPTNGLGVGAIPVFVGAQASAGGDNKIDEITVTGTATAGATHTVIVSGREGIDGERYDFNISTGDDPTAIAALISDAINNVLRSPFSATSALGVVSCKAKWEGLTSEDLVIQVTDNGNGAGVSYAVTNDQAGTGTPTITTTLNKMGSEWFTTVLNTYGAVAATMTELEDFNGIPSQTTPTGRYGTTVFKPFIAFTGSTLEDPSSLTDSRSENVTIAICPAPLSKGHPLEAAANALRLYVNQAQDTPHLDICGQVYPDMPFPTDGVIGSMSNLIDRNTILLKGCSTVDAHAGAYRMVDFVTTYHPVGEANPSYRYVRSLTIDFNLYFGYYLKEQQYVVDHLIAANDDIVTASKVVKPKTWKAVVNAYAKDLVLRGLTVDASFMQDSIQVGLSATNPDKLETAFDYKRSGFARQSATTVRAGFNFGTNQ